MKFFLQPGETLENGKINDVIVLGEDEAVILKAISDYKDDQGKEYPAGSIWMKNGPCDFIPPIEVQIIDQKGLPAFGRSRADYIQHCFSLDKNEGIYVRDKKNGEVKMIKGQTYMLSSNEELWEKPLDDIVEKLIS